MLFILLVVTGTLRAVRSPAAHTWVVTLLAVTVGAIKAPSGSDC